MKFSKEMKTVFKWKILTGEGTAIWFNSANTLWHLRSPRLCRRHRTSPAPRDLTLKEYPVLLRAGFGVRAVWGMYGGFGRSSPGQAPGARDKCVKGPVSQSGAEVAKLVTGLPWDWNCNQGDQARWKCYGQIKEIDIQERWQVTH